MADVSLKTTTQVVFADHAGDFAGGADAVYSMEVGTPTDVQILMSGVSDGAARQSAKVDLGATRPEAYSVHAAFEYSPTHTIGAVTTLYWSPSPQTTAANANMGNVNGVDSPYTGYINNVSDSVKQLNRIGNYTVASGTLGHGFVGIFSPPERYGSLVVFNNGGGSIIHSGNQLHIVFDPIVTQVV